jgi:hypothetical protein
MTRDTGAVFVRENFPPEDRLAIVLLNKRTDCVRQRLASAERIAAPDFQSWLRRENSRQFEVYISMNALRPNAQGRTKNDVAAIRHVYLDFDENGNAAVENLLKRQDLPKPNHLVNSSPDKWQVLWRVEGFGKEQAEALQRSLSRECGADPAATDCARVLRLPGFHNHKYAKPHLIRAESLTQEIYRPEHFPKISAEDRSGRFQGLGRSPLHRTGRVTQSERDWAFAKRALARGESPALVVAAIASYRRFDKPNPQYYAELTVSKAAQALKQEVVQSPEVERR